MIYFDCEHCGRTTRVADSLAGKKGKCPSCQKVVRVPAKSQPGAQEKGIAELTAALGRIAPDEPEDSRGSVPPPPPPPSTVEQSIDDLLLQDVGKDPGETDIFPSNQFAATPEGRKGQDQLSVSDGRRHHRPGAQKQPPARQPAGKPRVLLIVLGVLLVSALAAGAYLLMLHRR